MDYSKIYEQYDPNGVGVKGTLFGLPFDVNTAETIIVPIPWEVTVSYGAGCANAPEQVLRASPQLDVHDEDFPFFWQRGICLDEIPCDIKEENDALREVAKYYIDWLEIGSPKKFPDFTKGNFKIAVKKIPAHINAACEKLNEHVKNVTGKWLDAGKNVGLLGGDHSTPLGFLQALAERHEEFGILQIDAHADLRDAYEGFTYSHASIMFNALKISNISRLVQVGIRDYCIAERDLVLKSEDRIKCFYDQEIKTALYEGETWKKICKKIIKKLPQKVYISFDIDGLDPKLCPNTGTPVAGGFELMETFYLLKVLHESGRQIIGFDLNEVGDAEWDANVGARVLYKLTNLLASSR